MFSQAHENKVYIIKKVTLIGALINLVLSVVKILVGYLGQSQSLLADGLHSLSDLLSDALIWFTASHAAEGPDDEHPYGHARFETAATLALAILLAFVAVGISWDAINRLFHPEHLLIPASLTLWVAAFSIFSKEALFHYTLYASKTIRSPILKANAWHHRSDAISSIVVFIGIGGTILGLPYLDAIAAVAVGLMISHISWEIGWPALQELVDAGIDKEERDKISQLIESTPGVHALHMMRTRKHGGLISIDMHLQVNAKISVSEGHMIGQTVVDQLREKVEDIAEVTVHIDPEDDESSVPCRGLPLRHDIEKLLHLAWKDIPVFAQHKRLDLHFLNGQIEIELYLPISHYIDAETTNELIIKLHHAIYKQNHFTKIHLFYC